MKYPKIIWIKKGFNFKDKWWVSPFLLYNSTYNSDGIYMFLFKGSYTDKPTVDYYSYNLLKLPENEFIKIVKEVY